MNLRGLIFADDGENKKKQNDSKTEDTGRRTFKNKFPTSEATTPATTSGSFQPSKTFPSSTTVVTPDHPSCAPHLDKIMKMYEDGFDNLNQDGYDFYEFFKAVVQVGTENPAMYTMAFSMAQSMDPNVTKASLLSQAQFYINEITTVYNGYVANGKGKKDELLGRKETEESSLRQELINIDNEIQRLMALKAQKESELSTIDGKYATELTDVECKLLANDMAKDNLINAINTVVNGIKTNIK